ncbi:Metallo-beta-lactamase superfamily protein [Cnuella takakiae]|uniref:Metallo-beta-lactamase superfamily protein n=1 Tax=Cnuella takakiae TaxID=1302690 RepID=A0A1M4ZJ55_9BACT|nr:MBL fold metallo-hydrolase [Cnuella takakiae]SHF18008.1 Metallo-beta-lactamase superfamily protein [Cnuella takakiae]
MTEANNQDNSGLSSPFRGTGGVTGINIFPLSEGSFTIDKTKVFVPFDESEHQLTDRPTGSLLVEIQPFLVQTSKDLLLLDCGLGYNLPDGTLQLHDNIRKAGFQPEQVTKVLMSHLHKDHAGGIGNPQTGRFAGGHDLNLPNALYYVQQRELDYAWQTGGPSFLMDELEPLVHSPQVQFLHDDHGFIDGYIEYKHSGGHSPFHQVFWIREEGQTIFFGGDEAPQLSQMKVRYKTKYDFNPEKAMELRQQYWAQGGEEGWTFLFYHDIKNPVYPQP